MVEWIIMIFYLALNIIPLYLLKSEYLLAFFLFISIISLTIFLGSDYLKSMRNLSLGIAWTVLYLLIYFFQSYFIEKSDSFINENIEFMLKTIRLPLISIVYAQIFRVLFILKYNYEPSVYGAGDNIGHMILSKQTKNKEDYLWFFIGRFIVMIGIIYLNFVCF